MDSPRDLKFLVVSFCSGTYGNLLCQKLVKLRPDTFKLKHQVETDVLITSDGVRYYHNCQAFFEDLFYAGEAKYAFLNDTADINSVTQDVAAHPEFHELSSTHYNIIKTHMYAEDELSRLVAALGPATRVAQIGFDLCDIDNIAHRFASVMRDIAPDQGITESVHKDLLAAQVDYVNHNNLVFDFNKIQQDAHILDALGLTK